METPRRYVPPAISCVSLIMALATPTANAQNIIVTGENATYASGCALPNIPTPCPSQVTTALTPPPLNPASPWLLPTNFATGLLIGTNLSNSSGGPYAQGSVLVNQGAIVDSAYVHLGYEQNTEGFFHLTGAGSKWTNYSATVVGTNGKGTFQLSDGGYYYQPNSDHFFIGYGSTGEGLAIVEGVSSNGTRSTLDLNNRIVVGNFGKGELRILNGAYVASGYTTFISGYAGSEGKIIVDGVHEPTGLRSTLMAKNNNLQIGDEGTGTLIATNGALVEFPNYLTLGWLAGADAQAHIDGVHIPTGLRTTMEGGLIIAGNAGTALMTITNGALVRSVARANPTFNGAMYLGRDVGTSVVSVDGVNSTTGDRSTLEAVNLEIARTGQALLQITNGALLDVQQQINIAQNAAGRGTLHIDGQGSSGSATADILVGDAGQGTLTLSNGGKLSVPNVILAAQNTAHGVLNIGAGANAGLLDTASVTGGAGQAEVNFNHTENINFAPILTGSLQLTHSNAGKTTLLANNNYTGITRVLAGTLTAGTAQSFSSLSNYQIDPAGTMDLGGHTFSLPQINNAGTLQFGGQGGTQLTVTGDYIGNGGLIKQTAILGSDNSVTDTLIVMGDTSGTSKVAVHNNNGTGALTVEGIKIIQIQGASNAQFSLVGDYTLNGQQTVVGGAYAYQLYKGNSSGTETNDWYLRSELISPQKPGTVTPPPLYQAGVPIFESYPQFLLGLNELSDLQRRVGNRYWGHTPNSQPASRAASPSPAALSGNGLPMIEGNGVWGRFEGNHANIKPQSSTSNSSYSYDSYKMQIGLDHLLKSDDKGAFVGGLNALVVQGNASVNSVYGNGTISTTGYGMGATLTWYGNNDVYIDNQANITWYNSDLYSSTSNRSLVNGNQGLGFALSSEIGKRLALDDSWSVTPQAQLTYSHASFDSFKDTFGAQVSSQKADSLQLRVGASLNYHGVQSDTHGKSNRHNLYVSANLLQEFLGNSQVSVSGTTFSQTPERLWASIGVGGSYNWNDDQYSVYGEIALKTSLQSFGDSYGYRGIIGFRARW